MIEKQARRWGLVLVMLGSMLVWGCGGGGGGGDSDDDGDGDTTAPAVVATVPANGATGVAVNTLVSAQFGEQVDPATVNAATFSLNRGALAESGTVSYSPETRTATFTSTLLLEEGVLYTARLSTGIQDLAGNPLSEPFSWSFTTGQGGDGLSPSITARQPAPGAQGVAVTTTVRVTFSEQIDQASLTAASFFLEDSGGEAVAGSISYQPTSLTATFSPAEALAVSSTYEATVTTAVADLAGNPLPAAVSWTFTTEEAGGPPPPPF